MQNTTEEMLFKIFFPYANQRIEDAKNDCDVDFVHYTSAEAAAKIIQNQGWWMRMSSTMNDFQEVKYGIDRLNFAREKSGHKFRDALNKACPGLYDEVENELPNWKGSFWLDTFLTSFSTHHRRREDAIGRLSMWRAYGGASSVAIILNKQIFLGARDTLKIYGSPVAYFNDVHFLEKYEEVIGNVDLCSDFLRQQDRVVLKRYLYNVYRFTILSTKHPGFAEEEEWRIVHSPVSDGPSPLELTTATIGGTPQPVMVVPFTDHVAMSTGIRFGDLVDRLIIGPTQYPDAQYRAFVSLLGEAGVKNPERKVIVSDIPIRT